MEDLNSGEFVHTIFSLFTFGFQRGGRGGNGVSKNQIGTRGSDKIAQVPVGTVIHLVEGEQPSLAVNIPTRALDQWDIPGATEHSSASSNQVDNAVMKGLDGGLSHLHNAPKHKIDGNEAEKGSNSQPEKRKYLHTCFKPGFSNTGCDGRTYPHQEEIDENDQIESEDEDEFNFDEEDEEEEEREEQDVQYSVAEMTKPGQRLIIARGGEGGLGNAFIMKDMRPSKANRQDKIERLSTGQPGTKTFLILELTSIADVGLVGLPNAGKSTLLSALSRAQPEIADYEFTTLRPNIGSLTYEDYFSVKVADIPGLIKGAHENRGLGHAFLRHIERTKVLAYVLDLAATLNGRKGIPPWEQLQDIVVELEHYQEGLTRRPSLVVANKIDEEGADQMYEELKRRVQGVPIFPVCAILQEGVPDLRVGLRNLMDDSDPQGIDLSKISVQ
ncbi:putative GTP-binding protein OBGM, mitochondrial [Dichanthelium oligosanthes]|uniref:Putative GTP-binding protein OBGM, mitochondrial n=1 Tax=Dichanthelium oligosanthes TaxID=888268 RepID=A0A1E5UWN7_9POAL|nr:putative GTP-binding protein OBGM, mitochondrial [Dichanthelium oligosanthes]